MYYVGVSGYGNSTYDPADPSSGNSWSSAGNYQLNIAVNAPVFPSIEITNPMVGHSIMGAIAQQGGFQLYRFEATADSMLTAQTSAVGTGIDSFLRLFDAEGNELASDDDGGAGLYSLVEHQFAHDGVYYIGVSGYGNSRYDPGDPASGNSWSSTGDYQLTLTLVMPEPNANPAADGVQQVTFTNAVYETSAEITMGSEFDLYRFEASSGSTLRAETLAASGVSMDTYLRLFDATGNELARNDDGGSGFLSLIDHVFQADGEYLIGVSGYGNSLYNPQDSSSGRTWGRTGFYELRLSLEEAQQETPIPGAVDRSYMGQEDQALWIYSSSGLLQGVDPFVAPSLTIVLTQQPEHGQITVSSTGMFTYRPESNFHGIDEFRYRFENGAEQSNEATVRLTVAAVNDMPELATLLDVRLQEGEHRAVMVSASDIDGDTITLRAANLPEFVEFTDNGDGSGQLVMAPNFRGAGEYTINIVATDSSGSEVTQSFALDVENVNQAPRLGAIGEVTVAEGQSRTITVSATDPDRDPLTLRTGELPEFVSFTDHGDGTGMITIEAGYEASGEYGLDIIAADAEDETSANMTLTITNTNRAPLFVSPPGYRAVEGQSLTVLVSTIDADGDDIALTSGDLPGFVHFLDHGDGTGTFTISPDYDVAGEYTLQVSAADSEVETSGSFLLTVEDTNRAPVINVPATVIIDEGQRGFFDIHYGDPDGAQPTLMIEGLPQFASQQDLGRGISRVYLAPNYQQSGTYVLRIQASDSELVSPILTTSVEVQNVRLVGELLGENTTWGIVENTVQSYRGETFALTDRGYLLRYTESGFVDVNGLKARALFTDRHGDLWTIGYDNTGTLGRWTGSGFEFATYRQIAFTKSGDVFVLSQGHIVHRMQGNVSRSVKEFLSAQGLLVGEDGTLFVKQANSNVSLTFDLATDSLMDAQDVPMIRINGVQHYWDSSSGSWTEFQEGVGLTPWLNKIIKINIIDPSREIGKELRDWSSERIRSAVSGIGDIYEFLFEGGYKDLFNGELFAHWRRSLVSGSDDFGDTLTHLSNTHSVQVLDSLAVRFDPATFWHNNGAVDSAQTGWDNFAQGNGYIGSTAYRAENFEFSQLPKWIKDAFDAHFRKNLHTAIQAWLMNNRGLWNDDDTLARWETHLNAAMPQLEKEAMYGEGGTWKWFIDQVNADYFYKNMSPAKDIAKMEVQGDISVTVYEEPLELTQAYRFDMGTLVKNGPNLGPAPPEPLDSLTDDRNSDNDPSNNHLKAWLDDIGRRQQAKADGLKMVQSRGSHNYFRREVERSLGEYTFAKMSQGFAVAQVAFDAVFNSTKLDSFGKATKIALGAAGSALDIGSAMLGDDVFRSFARLGAQSSGVIASAAFGGPAGFVAGLVLSEVAGSIFDIAFPSLETATARVESTAADVPSQQRTLLEVGRILEPMDRAATQHIFLGQDQAERDRRLEDYLATRQDLMNRLLQTTTSSGTDDGGTGSVPRGGADGGDQGGDI